MLAQAMQLSLEQPGVHPLFVSHEQLLERARQAHGARGSQSPLPEIPNGKIYGELN